MPTKHILLVYYWHLNVFKVSTIGGDKLMLILENLTKMNQAAIFATRLLDQFVLCIEHHKQYILVQ